MTALPPDKCVAIIGSGPAGLIAATRLAEDGHSVTVYDHKPSIARKFLMAGIGGLNITHTLPFEAFLEKYGSAACLLRPALEAFPPEALRAWCEELGEETFVGTSGRVFPVSMKASPLLRVWRKRLDESGVKFRLRMRWTGWNENNHLLFSGPDGSKIPVEADATLLALGGASWPRLGSDGRWTEILESIGVSVTQLEPANCGFRVEWSDIFRARFAGTPVKNVLLRSGEHEVRGEMMITGTGIEGGAVYALSASLREALRTDGHAVLTVDLKADMDESRLAERLSQPRKRQTLTDFLRKSAGLPPVAIALLREAHSNEGLAAATPPDLARWIKALPIRLTATTGIERAISSAGGVSFDELDNGLMLKKRPGTFAAGEMLDWEAPTGGFLLQACFSTGVLAARSITDWLK